MVGLPGRGKSFIARSIVRHLDWIGLKSRIFDVKDRRRQEVAVYEPAEYFEAGVHVRTPCILHRPVHRQRRARAACACVRFFHVRREKKNPCVFFTAPTATRRSD